MRSYYFSMVFIIGMILSMSALKTQAKHILIPTSDLLLEWDVDSLPDDNDDFFKIAEEMPVFQGCDHLENRKQRQYCSKENLVQFLVRNLKYPKEAKDANKTGVAVIKFVVSDEGKVERAKIAKDPGYGMGEEALRVIKNMPVWMPGTNGGKKVNVQMALPVKFISPNGDDDETKELIKADNIAELEWNSVIFDGEWSKEGKLYQVKSEMPIAQLKSLLSIKEKGLPLFVDIGGEVRVTQSYYVSIGRSGTKYLVKEESRNKGLRKKLLKTLVPGDTLYFYALDKKIELLSIKITQ